MAELHPRLREDTFELGCLPLCRLLLMNDANWPWFILVPDRAGITEIHQLDAADQWQLTRESSFLALRLSTHFRADKLNIAALGNVVPQLHVHHIVRYRTDPAWPAPVWGRLAPKPYEEEALRAMRVFGGGLVEAGREP
ncbi:MAG: HIT family protein [Gammaproteobacteria bacterium]|nr:HIT family protein [Gammaproteobacteria bacterium]